MNVVRHENERFGSIFSRLDADHFNAFIDSLGFIDLPIGGRLFTWMNKAETKLSKLDRFLITKDVLFSTPDIRITALDHLWSDHTPIFLHVSKLDFGPTLVKFYNSWLLRDDFDDIVKSAWSNLETNNDGRILMPHEKLRSLKSTIKQWQVNVRINDRSQKQKAMLDLKFIDKKINDGTVTQFDLQKAHIKWDIEGAENSKFFHGMINQKWRTQAITGIMHDGVWISDPLFTKEIFLNFFKDKFQAHDSQVVFSPLALSIGLCTRDRDSFQTSVSCDEIKSAIWDCGSNKAPRPDGFSFAFIKKYWDLLKMDIYGFFNSFFESGLMPQGANSFFFTLIPKVSNPIFIKDFCPISFIGIHYKIIAKVLANRLSKVIDKIVSNEQSTFISGRQILDGPLILSEVIDWFKKRKKKMLIFKVDFEKAFDLVSWKYLDFVLISLGFGSKWRT
ncbi:putative RNA-directed DNA polymerase, eukaryota, reverse transcriptase zinc-binding domain protein [Tanacetum coccineum]